MFKVHAYVLMKDPRRESGIRKLKREFLLPFAPTKDLILFLDEDTEFTITDSSFDVGRGEFIVMDQVGNDVEDVEMWTRVGFIEEV